MLINSEKVLNTEDVELVILDFDFTLYEGDSLFDYFACLFGILPAKILKLFGVVIYKLRIVKKSNSFLLSIFDFLFAILPKKNNDVIVRSLSKNVDFKFLKFLKDNGKQWKVCSGNSYKLISAIMPNEDSSRLLRKNGLNLCGEKNAVLKDIEEDFIYISDNFEDVALHLDKELRIRRYYFVYEQHILGPL